MRTLEERLQTAKQDLEGAVETIDNRDPSAILSDVARTLRSKADFRSDIEHWLVMIESRNAAWSLIEGLEEKADGEMVPLGASYANFAQVRQIGVLAYISIQWALADQITKAAGSLLCTPEAGSNPTQPPQLLDHFIGVKRKKSTANVLYCSLRASFGWPVGVSYAIRNHFIHDGGVLTGSSFFEGPTVAAGFRISEAGWSRIEDRATKIYKVDKSLLGEGIEWPPSPRDDLRNVLRVCEREVDNVLGIIVGTACKVLLAQVGFMVGEQ